MDKMERSGQTLICTHEKETKTVCTISVLEKKKYNDNNTEINFMNAITHLVNPGLSLKSLNSTDKLI